MLATEFIWMNGTLVPWDKAQVHVLTHALHYGSGAFEGIRVYKTDKGPAVFRLREHMERFLYSASALDMKSPYELDALCNAVIETVTANKMQEGYIRPLIYFGYGVMGLNPRNAPVDVMVACWPWDKYLGADMVDIKTSSYIRIHPRSTKADAKICGHYINSIMAVLELKGTHYHEALFLDLEGKIAEGPGENFFLIKDGQISTPPLGKILAGITRNTVFQMAERLGMTIQEREISLEEAYQADEAFFTGTAAEISPIRSIDDKVLGEGAVGPISGQISHLYHDIVRGKEASFERFLTRIAL